MINNSFLLKTVFLDPITVKKLSLSEWDLLIRQARKSGVLARLAWYLEEYEVLKGVYKQPLTHFRSAQTYSKQFNLSLEWEILCIKKALDKKKIPLVLLKGAAYSENSLKVAKGRVFSDVDILVEKDKLKEVEVLLITEGWMPSIVDGYDQKYYRQWMHEIPPLTHAQRNTSIDVHHNILPKTAKHCPDSDKLFSNLTQIKGKDIWVLAYEDQVLHSATHLFHEGEFHHGFRDLSDLNMLMCEFSKRGDFWDQLLIRATELDQQLPLFLALRYSKLFFETPIPVNIMQLSRQRVEMNCFQIKVMDFLFERALKPDHSSCDDGWTHLARWLLYIRAQYLRMPLYLLIPHLLRKGRIRLIGKTTL